MCSSDLKLSMDGRGAWRDNVFVERLWRSVKYEGVYLRAYDSANQARVEIADYLNSYTTQNSENPPQKRYRNLLPPAAHAA